MGLFPTSDFGFGRLLPRQHDAKQIHRHRNVLQLGRRELFQACFQCVANLPLHVHRHANPARARQRLDARGDVHSVAIDIAAAMHHITNVYADLQFDASLGRHVVVALGQGALDFDGALGRFQRAVKLDQESVTDRFDLGAVEARKDFAEQLAMFLQQFQRQLVVALRQRTVAHHVGEHDGGQLALFGAGAHWSRQTFSSVKKLPFIPVLRQGIARPISGSGDRCAARRVDDRSSGCHSRPEERCCAR